MKKNAFKSMTIAGLLLLITKPLAERWGIDASVMNVYLDYFWTGAGWALVAWGRYRKGDLTIVPGLGG